MTSTMRDGAATEIGTKVPNALRPRALPAGRSPVPPFGTWDRARAECDPGADRPRSPRGSRRSLGTAQCSGSAVPMARLEWSAAAGSRAMRSAPNRRSRPPTLRPSTRHPSRCGRGWCRWAGGAASGTRWVDRLLFPANGPSADTIVPELQQLAVGDRILDGPPEAKCAFVVAGFDANHHLVLHSREHLPPGWAERYGAWIDFTWAFVLDDLGEGRTRFVFRSRSRVGPRWVRACYLAAVVPADFVMSRQMLRGVKHRAEGSAPASGASNRLAA
jgi:hypothetical protein